MDTNPQDRLELVLQASNEGVWDWYVGQEEIYYSERVLRFLGHEKETAPNLFLDPYTHIHEDDREAFARNLADTVDNNGQNNLAMDARYDHPDGSWHWLRIRGVAVRDEMGKAQRLVGSFIDISRRKRAERAVEEERHRLVQLIENIPVNVYYKDKDSKFVLANSSTAKKLGAGTVENLIGKSDHDFFDSKHADIARTNEVEIMETRKPQVNQIQRETWTGKEDTWAETTKLPWIDIKGELIGTFGITNDITDLVRSQRMLTEVAEELQSRNIAIEEELQLAREIQQALLPQSLEGLTLRSHDREVTFGCRYVPASEMAGDFFEVIPISQHAIGILICDVMGHGVRASLVVSILRGLMEKERDSATSPEWFLYGMNEGLVSIFERAGVTLFATAIYCVVDLKEGVISYSSAGHPAPISVRLGESQILPVSKGKANPALGLIPQATYTGEKIHLDDVDRLLLMTDGLHEVENRDNEQLGMEGVQAAFKASHADDLEASLDKVLETALAHSKTGEFDDDVCLFAIGVGSGL